MDFRDIKEFFMDTIQYIIMVFFILVMVIYVVSLQQVVGPSMSPNLNEGDVLILNKTQYKMFDVKRGQIISVAYADTKYLIKRVVGLPGEAIEFKDGKLYINGKFMEETYLKGIKTDDFDLNDIHYTTIPKDMYLVLGDNRGNSLDSRRIGLVKKKEIIGKVMLRLWPLNGFRIYW